MAERAAPARGSKVKGLVVVAAAAVGVVVPSPMVDAQELASRPVDTAEPTATSPSDTAPPATTAPPPDTTNPTPDANDPDESAAISTVGIVIGVIGIVVLLALAAWWMLRRDDPDDAPHPPGPSTYTDLI